MYGETGAARHVKNESTGLSPHVRGNRQLLQRVPVLVGSIPACTGKPGTVAETWMTPRVYPRMYGETGRRVGRVALVPGLSPHVRGNPATA